MREASESPSTTTFATLLSSLAGSPPQSSRRWAEDSLPEDVAVLSYEQALRAQSRRRTEPGGDAAAFFADPPSASQPAAAEQDYFSDAAPETAAPAKDSLYQQSLKTASITIRMSQAESDALHRRAAEAGMTVSAYLRYCALEVETLRGAVKQAMAELKEAAVRERQPEAPAPSGWLKRLSLWITPWRDLRQTARA
jgi:predicted DNA binding CopG/RHH family protein